MTVGLGQKKPYRFGFILSTSLGNITRYQNLRKYAERDPEVEFHWAPVKHYYGPGEKNPVKFVPRPFSARAIVLAQSYPVLRQLNQLDAVMVHMYEADIVTALRKYFRKGPIRVASTDDAPIVDRSDYPVYPIDINKPEWKKKVRLALDLWRVRQSDLFIPYSSWLGNKLVKDCGVPQDKVHSIHVGLDLDIWKLQTKPDKDASTRLNILFVGGDFVRKGGDLLLKVFKQRFADTAELHLVTKEPPSDLPPHVHVYTDINANDPRLAQLFAQADVFAVPTTADLVPWVYMEAMALGCPTIATRMGAIPHIVRHGETGLLIPVGDGEALAQAIQSMIDNPALRRQMGLRGREIVERDFNASVNVPRILQVMKDAVDRQRPLTPSP